ncbi:MAG TPA: RagB/SusD family nutrient uptake outer membrane protein [Ferruginibacter sp.]|nr:RagB/SusD family nutrient uptake outer membrane protein [Ferruginibacter sp.]MBN8700628.1 RagB/SusD family nutrient uptake outer membrane protein [Chitinophagales bacterium]TXH30824.1 MAG: RagB/SusD family nutrient uptake outer membrane protein [Cyclobacteriaceae bacterium]HMZ99726.1 RagB/SusD family nutrient uptake outer membrane protein [Ferruginibacter sp.]HNA15926.1 RagB/SusD family nutrient uptake outer membrane protein [Ferruginibacter sp.]
MTTYKKQIARMVIAVLAITLFGSCKKFLDRKPLGISQDDIQGGALEGRALGLYGAIRNSNAQPYCGDGFQNIPWVAMNGFRSDDAELVADPGASAWHQTYDNFQYTKDDWGAGLYWDKHYVFIGLCNDALDEAVKGNYTDPGSLINIAEARFFRAYAYFDLVRTFGAVPKIDFKINVPSDGNVAKSDTAVIYNLILQDLTYAEQYLPLSWSTNFAGRLTSWAAKSLHAKVLMQQRRYAEALPICRDVIVNGPYSLFSPYWKMFKKEGELCSESIFEIQASKKAGDGNNYWSRLGQCQGVRGSGTWDLGWGWNTPTANLVNAYEAGDVRKDATILYSNQSDGGTNTGGYGLVLPNLTNALYWNKKVYNQYSDYLAAGLGTPNNEAQNTWVNHRVLRLADILLLGAEAANESAPGGSEATTWLNRVRNRANLGNIAYVNQAQMRAAIKQERRVEFGMEYERFFDLVRYGDAINVLGGNGYQNKHRYYPIPTSALNSNPNLVQNPEW